MEEREEGGESERESKRNISVREVYQLVASPMRPSMGLGGNLQSRFVLFIGNRTQSFGAWTESHWPGQIFLYFESC